jgi:osmotically-inducible protein OsmY
MFSGDRTSDKELFKTVSKRLVRIGGGTQRLAATVARGTVTITGLIRYEAQRRPIIKAISSIAGVARVIDQLQLAQKPAH